MTKVSKEVVEEVGEAVREAYNQGKKTGTMLKEEIIDPVTGYYEARGEQERAEKEARIMERATEIKRAHPKVPGKKAVEHARNEEEAGMLKD